MRVCLCCGGQRFARFDRVMAPAAGARRPILALRVRSEDGWLDVGHIEAVVCTGCRAVYYFARGLGNLEDFEQLHADGVATVRGAAPCEMCRSPEHWAVPFERDHLFKERPHYASVCKHCGYLALGPDGWSPSREADGHTLATAPPAHACTTAGVQEVVPAVVVPLTWDPAWNGLATVGRVEERHCPSCGRVRFRLDEDEMIRGLVESLQGEILDTGATDSAAGPYR
jgi:hypothetical protein